MKSNLSHTPDTARSRLRTTLAKMEREIADLTERITVKEGDPTSGLAASWRDLVEQLALGPEPDLRQCPVCGNVTMRTATLCGHCWTKLAPPTGSEIALG
jgi:hypothetical protein